MGVVEKELPRMFESEAVVAVLCDSASYRA